MEVDVLKRVPVREQDPKVRATNFEEVCYGYNKEEAMAPEEIRMISTPDLCSSAIWSTSADIRVTSNVPSRRAKTLLPTFTAIRVNSCFIFANDLKAQI